MAITRAQAGKLSEHLPQQPGPSPPAHTISILPPVIAPAAVSSPVTVVPPAVVLPAAPSVLNPVNPFSPLLNDITEPVQKPVDDPAVPPSSPVRVHVPQPRQAKQSRPFREPVPPKKTRGQKKKAQSAAAAAAASPV